MNNAEHFEFLLASEEAAHRLRMHVKTLQRLSRASPHTVCPHGRFRLTSLGHFTHTVS